MENKIISGLEKISEVYRILLWEKAKKYRLSPIQIQILLFLKSHIRDLCTVSSLSSEFNLTRPTISDAIKSLFEKNLIRKISAKDDSRSYVIVLKKKGINLLSDLSDFALPIETVLTEFNEDQKIAFFDSISTLIYHFHKNGIISTQRICFTCKYFDTTDERYCHLLERKLFIKDIRLDCEEHVLEK